MFEPWCGATVFVLVIGLCSCRDLAKARRPYARSRAALLLLAILLGWFVWGPMLALFGQRNGVPEEVSFFVLLPLGLVLGIAAGLFVAEVVLLWVLGRPQDGDAEVYDDEPE